MALNLGRGKEVGVGQSRALKLLLLPDPTLCSAWTPLANFLTASCPSRSLLEVIQLPEKNALDIEDT